jgi:membrane dipeptidase
VSDVGLQVCAIYVGHDDDDPLRQVLRYARCFRAAVEANRGRAFAVETAGDIDRVGADGRTALLLSLEGAAPLGEDPWLIDVLFDLGVRMAALTWNERNAFAAGCDHDEGLTLVGAEAIARMAARGIVLDLAHASPRTMADARSRSTPTHRSW